MLTRKQAINFLIKTPEKLGHMLGFSDLIALHREWIRLMILATEDTTLQAHRNSYKTTCVSIALAIIMILYPNKRILFMRKTDDDVKEIIKQVKNILLHPKVQYLVQCIYGIKLRMIVDNAMELSTNLTTDVKGTSQLVGTGIGSSLTGQHYDIIFTDDIVNVKDRTSRAERERTKMVYDELQNIKKKGIGRIFNTGTPWHKEDAFTKMPDPITWDVYSTGIFEDWEIADLKESMAPSLFAANYELKHIAAEDVIFANAQLHGDIDMIFNAKYDHIDAAYGGEDFSAFTTGNKVGDKFYILGKMWNKHIDECIPEILAIKKKYLIGTSICEDNGDKGYLKKELIRQGDRASSYWEDTNKYIKIVTYLKSEWKNVIFVEGTDQEYIDQILEYNEFAEHDDAPDSCASFIRKLWNKAGRELSEDNKIIERTSLFGY